MSIEYKGGHMRFNSPYIIIISNIAPGDQYGSVRKDKIDQWEAYMRRVENSIDVYI